MRYAKLGIGATALIVVAIYWFATGGRPAQPSPAWLRDRPFAHRGLHDTPARPENSHAAFAAAIEAGHPIELDVHLSADGHVVVVHDDDLGRLAGDPRPVSDIPLAELQAVSLLGTEESVPTLASVLELVDGRVPVLIEIKNRGAVGPLEDAVAEQLLLYSGDVAVMSFNPYTLSRMAEVAPDVTRGQLSGTFSKEDLPAYQVFALKRLLMNWTSKPHFIAYELDALPSLTTSLQRLRGRTLLAWTPADARTAERASSLSDNIICDPGGFAAVRD